MTELCTVSTAFFLFFAMCFLMAYRPPATEKRKRGDDWFTPFYIDDCLNNGSDPTNDDTVHTQR